MKRIFFFLQISLCVILFKNTYSQNTIDTEYKKQANEYYVNSDWDKAIEMYKKIVEVEENNLNAWVRLSNSYINKKDFENAFKILKTAVTKGDNPNLWYNLSCMYAMKNQKTESMSALKKAVTSGFASTDRILNHSDFYAVKNDSDFLSLVEEIKKNEFPCEYNQRLKEFEFWVGQWDVFTTLGSKAGTSKIEKILNQCVIMENWENISGRKGKSFNVINSLTGNWEQTWVDDSGNITEFKKGKYENGALSFMAEETDTAQKKQWQRLTFFNNSDGTVRQLGEFSTDGINWQITYDLLYIRKK